MRRVDKHAKILIAGDRSQVSKDLKELLILQGYDNIIGCNRSNLDLRNQAAVERFFAENHPNAVFLAAAAIPGNNVSDYELLHDNLLIVLNVVDACLRHGAEKIVYISSTGALPYLPLKEQVTEEDLSLMPLESSKWSYNFAKLAASEACILARHTCDIYALLPCNIYGDVTKGLVYSLVRDFIMAKENRLDTVVIWGTPNIECQFIHSRDVASAAYFAIMQNMAHDCYIVAPEKKTSKEELVRLIAREVGYNGGIIFDKSKTVYPTVNNASPARLMKEGWRPKVTLEDGIREMVEEMRSKGE